MKIEEISLVRMLWKSSPPSMVTVTFQGYVVVAAKVHVTAGSPRPLDYAMEPTKITVTFQGYIAITAKVHVTAGSQRPLIFAVEMKLLHSYIGRSLPI